jgi:hypothetical protein
MDAVGCASAPPPRREVATAAAFFRTTTAMPVPPWRSRNWSSRTVPTSAARTEWTLMNTPKERAGTNRSATRSPAYGTTDASRPAATAYRDQAILDAEHGQHRHVGQGAERRADRRRLQTRQTGTGHPVEHDVRRPAGGGQQTEPQPHEVARRPGQDEHVDPGGGRDGDQPLPAGAGGGERDRERTEELQGDG